VHEGHWTIDGDGARHVVRLSGSIDIAAEQPLLDDMDSLFACDDLPVEFDLSGVDFMDSTGVRTLLVLRNRYQGRVLLGDLSPPVQRLFEIAGVLGMLRPSDDAGDRRGDLR
jgi:anti-sigma B factor antagonist